MTYNGDVTLHINGPNQSPTWSQVLTRADTWIPFVICLGALALVAKFWRI